MDQETGKKDLYNALKLVAGDIPISPRFMDCLYVTQAVDINEKGSLQMLVEMMSPHLKEKDEVRPR